MKRIQLLLIAIGLIISVQTYSQETYKIGSTEYYYNKTYTTTGKPMVKRSEANKAKFLRSKGYSSTPYGYEIDHIIPLSKGGTDDPSNMQLLTIHQHARKTARERASRTNSTYNTYRSFNSSSTYKNTNTIYPPELEIRWDDSTPSSSSSVKTIYTGKNGGKYYINSNGNKTYIKKKSNSSYNYSTPTNSYSTPSYNYNSGRTIHTGSRGGKYYINSNGNKTYIKK